MIKTQLFPNHLTDINNENICDEIIVDKLVDIPIWVDTEVEIGKDPTLLLDPTGIGNPFEQWITVNQVTTISCPINNSIQTYNPVTHILSIENHDTCDNAILYQLLPLGDCQMYYKVDLTYKVTSNIAFKLEYSAINPFDNTLYTDIIPLTEDKIFKKISFYTNATPTMEIYNGDGIIEIKEIRVYAYNETELHITDCNGATNFFQIPAHYKNQLFVLESGFWNGMQSPIILELKTCEGDTIHKTNQIWFKDQLIDCDKLIKINYFDSCFNFNCEYNDSLAFPYPKGTDLKHEFYIRGFLEQKLDKIDYKTSIEYYNRVNKLNTAKIIGLIQLNTAVYSKVYLNFLSKVFYNKYTYLDNEMVSIDYSDSANDIDINTSYGQLQIPLIKHKEIYNTSLCCC